MKKSFFGDIPLPADNPNENLETISRNKLFALLDTTLFEVRPETIRDKGNDLIVEIKHDSCYTNFHFSVQLKSTDAVFDGVPEEFFLNTEKEPKWSIDSLFKFKFPD